MSSPLLVALPFLQSWNGTALKINVLLLPRANPLEPLTPAEPGSTSFANASFNFNVHIQADIDTLPVEGTGILTTISSATVSTALPIFQALQNRYPISPAAGKAVRHPSNRVRKYAPITYQTAVQSRNSDSGLLVFGREYSCAITYPTSPYKPLPPNPLMSWGKVFAILLRNPSLAKAAGMIRTLEFDLAPTLLENGGYTWISLAEGGDGVALSTSSGDLKTYATRIPALSGARDLFTPVFIPVKGTPAGLNYDRIFSEVEDYNDGWAKAVHCSQAEYMDPTQDSGDGRRPSRETGLLIGWDDEQMTLWMNRQMAQDVDGHDSPFGIMGYRIDVRKEGESSWESLVKASGPLSVDDVDLGRFEGDLHVEVHPTNSRGEKTGDFWLPIYLSTWTGTSLVTKSPDRMRLLGVEDYSMPPVRGSDPETKLLYGNTYEVRVRFMDQTGGGPDVRGSPSLPGPQPIAKIPFKRWIPPLQPQIDEEPGAGEEGETDDAPNRVTLRRPLLHSNAVLCTSGYTDAMSLLLADLSVAQASRREPGLPDPDVDRVEISVEVAALQQDPIAPDGMYMPVASVTRAFPQDLNSPLLLDIVWDNVADITQLSVGSDGPLHLPMARQIRLRVNSLCREDPQTAADRPLIYFGSQDVRHSSSLEIKLTKTSTKERSLFQETVSSKRFCALYLQPDVPADSTSSDMQSSSGRSNEKVSDIATRFASALELRNDQFTIRPQKGRRAVFVCSSSMQYILGPDGGNITFSSQNDLALRWLVVLRMTIKRDWTWSGLSELRVSRDGVIVDIMTLPRTVNHDALISPNRSETDVIIIDAVDPKPLDGTPPKEISLTYRLQCIFQGSPEADDPIEFKAKLPVTTPPAQVPQIVSAGIALSPYQRASDYSSTEPRRRALWIELAEPPQDQRDVYFARVLQYAPDPLLADPNSKTQLDKDPPLPIDPEPVRKITEDQSNDFAGLYAMQELEPSDSPLHWSLPLPPGMSDQSPELFGLFTYELRVGHHHDIWSTAQGRFGPPLRVTGIQHSAPILPANVLRTRTEIKVSMPNALPINNGRTDYPKSISSSLWVLLYAQAARLDGNDFHNVFLTAVAAQTAAGFHSNVVPYAEASFDLGGKVFPQLLALGFSTKAALSIMAVELIPQGISPRRPLTADLGTQRILRCSPLVAVPGTCP